MDVMGVGVEVEREKIRLKKWRGSKEEGDKGDEIRRPIEEE